MPRLAKCLSPGPVPATEAGFTLWSGSDSFCFLFMSKQTDQILGENFQLDETYIVLLFCYCIHPGMLLKISQPGVPLGSVSVLRSS